MTRFQSLLFVILIVLLPNFNSLLAQDGTVDLNFGTSGRTVIDFSGDKSGDKINLITLQNDGKIISAGTVIDVSSQLTKACLMRLKVDGSLDSTFNGTGRHVLLKDSLQSTVKRVLIQSDNKIVVVGSIFSAVSGSNKVFTIRLNTDGRLDNSYGNNGISLHSLKSNISSDEYQTQIIADNKILVLYSGLNSNFSFSYTYVSRIDSNGKLDTTFANKGHLLVDSLKYVQTVDIQKQSSDKFLVARYSSESTVVNTEILRFTNNGVLDTTFATKGKFKKGVLNDILPVFMKVHTDGKIYILQNSLLINNLFPIIRISSEGVLDASFGKSGQSEINPMLNVTYPTPYSFLIDKNGRCIVLGAGSNADQTSTKSFLIRFLETGLPDLTFGSGGVVAIQSSNRFHYLESIAIQSDGKIVTGGWNMSDFLLPTDSEVMRFNGTFTTGLNQYSAALDFMVYPNPTNSILYIIEPSDSPDLKIELYTSKGEKLLSTSQRSISTEKYSNGIYFLRVIDGNKIGLKKMVIQH